MFVPVNFKIFYLTIWPAVLITVYKQQRNLQYIFCCVCVRKKNVQPEWGPATELPCLFVTSVITWDYDIPPPPPFPTVIKFILEFLMGADNILHLLKKLFAIMVSQWANNCHSVRKMCCLTDLIIWPLQYTLAAPLRKLATYTQSLLLVNNTLWHTPLINLKTSSKEWTFCNELFTITVP